MTFFDNFTNKPKRNFSCSGDKEEPVYVSRFDKEGNIELIKDHVRNNYLEIQSHRDACDLMTLLARYEAGDIDALNQRNGTYIDSVGMPHNMVELLNTIAIGETEFYKLPLALREEFGNSLPQFFAAMDDPKDFATRIEKFDFKMRENDKPAEKKESEVVKE